MSEYRDEVLDALAKTLIDVTKEYLDSPAGDVRDLNDKVDWIMAVMKMAQYYGAIATNLRETMKALDLDDPYNLASIQGEDRAKVKDYIDVRVSDPLKEVMGYMGIAVPPNK